MRLYTSKVISKSEEMQTEILKAAQKLFAERGYGAIMTKELAKAADVVEGTLFGHAQTNAKPTN